jgi:hypothetical protein
MAKEVPEMDTTLWMTIVTEDRDKMREPRLHGAESAKAIDDH